MAWYPRTVTVAAAAEPVSLAEAKAQCRVDGTDEDDLINGLIAQARAYVEDTGGRALLTQTIAVKCDGFEDFSNFPVVPLVSVSSISYVDGAGSTQTLASSVYEARSDGPQASLTLKSGQSWPSIQSGSRITVTAVVGAAAVDLAVKRAILLLIGWWHSQREAVNVGNIVAEVPHAVDALLANHREYSF